VIYDPRVQRIPVSRRGFLGLGAAALAAGPRAVVGEAAARETIPATPAAALAELTQGNARFVKGEVLEPRRELERVRKLAGKRQPYAAVLGCADSRVPIEIVFDEGFGNVFAVRVAGNLATPVEIASLEYAVAVLGTKVIMVLGHENSGAVKAALEGKEVPGQISTLYQYIVPGIDRVHRDLGVAVRANVRFQARKLQQASPVLGAAVKGGTLQIAGGVFELGSGRVLSVDV
jgi:carbonic anhydrase